MKPSLVLLAPIFATSLYAAPGTVNEPFTKFAFTQDLGKAGSACAPLGDLNGDGNPDLAVGIEGNRSVVIFFLRADRSLISFLAIRENEGGLPAGSATDGSRFGASLANLGDLDGDGLPELAVGAPGEGIVYILFLRADGSVRETIRPLVGPTFTDIGASCAAVGDLDGNGVTELIVGVPFDDFGTNGTDSGSLFVLFLNSDGSLANSTTIANGNGGANDGLFAPGDNFGSSCALIGDLNFDGFPEVAVGSRESDIGGPNKGLVFTFSLTAAGNAQNFREFSDTGGVPLGNQDRFGSSVVSLGDIDGNGVPDLAVGAPNDGASNFGAVHILFLAPDGALASSFKIADGTSGGLPFLTLNVTDENFGSSLALLGRSATTGLPLLAVGTPGDSTGGDDRGAVYLLELGDDPITVTTLTDEFDTPSTNGSGVSLREAIRDADATGQFRTIRFDAALGGGILSLNSPLLVQTQSLRITGEGLDTNVRIQNNSDRLFTVTGATLTVDSFELADGNAASGGGALLVGAGSRLVLDRVTIDNCQGGTGGGGAILAAGSVTIMNSALINNSAETGGAIRVSGTTANLTVLNTTFSGNDASGATTGGGAILNADNASTRIRYSTFTSNTTGAVGGGILNDSGSVVVGESLFFANTAVGGSADFDSFTTDAGGNALNVTDFDIIFSPDLFGGPTVSQPLTPLAAEKGTAFHRPFPIHDQRGEGFPRTRGTGRDPGAVEATELTDFQHDSRIGLTLGRQIGNNRYNSTGVGQTIRLNLKGKRKAKSFFTLENESIFPEALRIKSDRPDAKTLRGKVFALVGGERRNFSAEIFGTGALGEIPPGLTVVFQADWSRKSMKLKPKQTVKISANSLISGKRDVVGAKVGAK